ncbi:MAG: PHP domain-containing protein [Bacilli bacterium]|nr:PHP domain-containing protein [Bacilli bacterium]
MSRNFGYNYHTHTYRCGHAVGDEFEMVETAVKHKYKIFGVSDHIFLPGISQEGVRGDYECYDEYVSNLKYLKKKYQGKLELYSAFECEDYGPKFFDYYFGILARGDADYLILGQHCKLNDAQDDVELYHYKRDPIGSLHQYTDDLIRGMESGLYIYVCHPDLFHKFLHGWNEEYEKASRRIIEKAIELDLPLEVNMCVTRTEKEVDENGDRVFSYPCHEFWDIAHELGAKCILGVDAHDPRHLYNTEFSELRKFIKRHHLKPMTKLDIEGYRKKLFDRYGLTKKSN